MFFKKEIEYSNKNIQDLLPVGTIITIKEKEGKYMICDYRGTIKDKISPKKLIEVDYWCVAYPLGVFEDNSFAITHDQVENIIFMGYTSQDRIDFCSELNSYQEGIHE